MKIKLFMIPFSGGGSHSYDSFLEYAPDWLEMIQLELPGHGKRIGEQLITDIHIITEDLYAKIGQQISSPYAVYGHSFGATLAYLLCRKIIASDIAPPSHLFISGRIAPSCRSKEILHPLPATQFLRGVLSYGGIPEQVLREPELIRLFLPIFQADFKAIETYVHEYGPPLPIPITAMAGSEDKKVDFVDVMQWQEMTSFPLSIRKFTGGHFFIFQNIDHIVQLFVDSLNNLQNDSYNHECTFL